MPRDTYQGMQRELLPPSARDVVCGREVDPVHAKGETEYGGETYYFCSEECTGVFEDDPARYASETQGSGRGSRMPWPGWPKNTG